MDDPQVGFHAMVRVVLIAAIVISIFGCNPLPTQPPCTKTGADSYGTPLCPLSAEQVTALPDAQLYYPGSTLIWSYAESGRTSADVRSALDTSASPSEVMGWYDRTLVASGWVKKWNGAPYQYVRHPPDSTYCEFYWVEVLSTPTYPSPDPPPPPGGAYYDVKFDVPFFPSLSPGGPDASGNAVILPCGGGLSA